MEEDDSYLRMSISSTMILERLLQVSVESGTSVRTHHLRLPLVTA